MALRFARSCIQSVLKVVNSLLGMVGIAMIMYALWMFRVWQKHMAGPSPPPFFGPNDAPIPWFIYTILGLGITLCFITCSGHIAAETANGCCLYIYMVFIFLLLVLEAAVTVDVFLNNNWEEDFPEDTTGNFDEIKSFVNDNFDLCKWIGLSVLAVQGLSILLSMVLKAMGPHRERYYESDDDYTPDGAPLLKNYVPQTSYVVGDPVYGSKSDSWNIRINSKAAR
ncbi:tetraspanin-19-like [Ipomoea triloba]|uniref:tetraspanin-19-like n=1 Tax=Ipomoea triloba TaxID=35885 RepID=UPI00125D9DF4|nr:tetraspanin-19-like [Ipomoea triloba]